MLLQKNNPLFCPKSLQRITSKETIPLLADEHLFIVEDAESRSILL